MKPGAVDVVRIDVSSLIPGETIEEDKMMTVYSAWMFKTSRKQSADMPEIVWFPVMLYTGKLKHMTCYMNLMIGELKQNLEIFMLSPCKEMPFPLSMIVANLGDLCLVFDAHHIPQ